MTECFRAPIQTRISALACFVLLLPFPKTIPIMVTVDGRPRHVYRLELNVKPQVLQRASSALSVNRARDTALKCDQVGRCFAGVPRVTKGDGGRRFLIRLHPLAR
jgi:hypothetical protein